MILSRQPALSAFSFLPSLSKHPSGEARQTEQWTRAASPPYSRHTHARAFKWPPRQPDPDQQREKNKGFSWLCFVASISLTVIKNNADSGSEWSLSLLGFLPLAGCHSLHTTRHEDRSPPHLSLSKEIDSMHSGTGSNIAYCLGGWIQVLAPTLQGCVLEHIPSSKSCLSSSISYILRGCLRGMTVVRVHKTGRDNAQGSMQQWS